MSVKKPEDKYVKLGKFDTRFWSMGEMGSPVVFVHALLGSVEFSAPNIGPLARHHRVYSLDLMGFGRTDKFQAVPQFADWTRFIKDFLDSQGIVQANLVGGSVGGGFSARFAFEFPDRVKKLVLLAPAGLGRDVSMILRLLSIPVLGEVLGRPSRKRTERLLRSMVYDPSVVSDDLVDVAYELSKQPGAVRCVLSTLRLGANFMGQRESWTRPTLEGMSRIAVPTLVVWGRQDTILPVSQADVAAQRIANATVHLIDRCGHVPGLEHPVEVNKLLLEFLAD